MYDLCIAYRIYPKVSKIPPVYEDDKLKLSELCLRSFKKSLGDLKIKMYVLMDNCDNRYQDLFDKYFDENELIKIPLNAIGNNATFKLQLQLLLEQKYSDLVYFAEDDYFYQNSLKDMINFFIENPEVSFATPYDHLDYYNMNWHRGDYRIKYCNIHWRTAISTCLTFMARKSSLQKCQRTFMSYAYGNYDFSLWTAITKRRLLPDRTMWNALNEKKAFPYLISPAYSWLKCWRQILFGQRYELWSPIPSIATHMEKDFIAPSMNNAWENCLYETNTVNDNPFY